MPPMVPAVGAASGELELEATSDVDTTQETQQRRACMRWLARGTERNKLQSVASQGRDEEKKRGGEEEEESSVGR